MSHPEIFHAGECAMQRDMKVAPSFLDWAAQVVRPEMPRQHRTFFSDLPFVVLAARDDGGRPWVTPLSGPSGFISSPSASALEIAAEPFAGDALEGHLHQGAHVGLLGLDFATRRRNRVNGQLTTEAGAAGSLNVDVRQSFGNCPQHIHERAWRIEHRRNPSTTTRHQALTPEAIDLVQGANTFFVGSGFAGDPSAPSTGMDASHRGGPTGFVTVQDERTLCWPEYAGNNHFNTLGNLREDPRIALLFIDFENGHVLQLTGNADIRRHSERTASDAPHRVFVTIEEAVWTSYALDIRWHEPAASQGAARVIDKRRASRDAVSITLRPLAGTAASAKPGQHLPIAVTLPGGTVAHRTYSLSELSDATYRVTVKRVHDGIVSRYLNDTLEVGDVVTVGRPAGDFVLRDGQNPVVLIGAGVGLTPLVPMLDTLARHYPERRAQFIYATRSGEHFPLGEEIKRLTGVGRRTRHVLYSQPSDADRAARSFDIEGRLNAATLTLLIEDLSADFYLCGPPAFMTDVRSWLHTLGVPEDRVAYEAF